MGKTKTIGFIGLGIMGRPMANNLIKEGYTLVVYDIVKDFVDDVVSRGAKEGTSLKDVAMQSDVIITMLPSMEVLREVVFGKDSILDGAKEGTTIIDMSSVAPALSKEIAIKAKKQGVNMLDAPVSGGEPKAKDGTLAIMVGGEQDVFDECEGLFKAMGSSIVLIGEVGSGNVAKLANQIIVAVNIAAVGEALVLATKAGVDPEKVYEAIRGGLAGSTVLDAKVPMILNGDFTPGARLELHIKDLNNALDTAGDIDAPVPLTKDVMKMMMQLKTDGKESIDHGGIIQYYEKISGVKVRK